MILPEFFGELKAFLPYVTAAILFIVVFAMPQGIVGLSPLLRMRKKEKPVPGSA
jgi:hypothetical protein